VLLPLSVIVADALLPAAPVVTVPIFMVISLSLADALMMKRVVRAGGCTMLDAP
jgi:hypothetical protein